MILRIDDCRVAWAEQQGLSNRRGQFIFQYCVMDHHRAIYPLRHAPKFDPHSVNKWQFRAGKDHVDADHSVMAERQQPFQAKFARCLQNAASNVITDISAFIDHPIDRGASNPGARSDFIQSHALSIVVFRHNAKLFRIRPRNRQESLIAFNQQFGATTCQARLEACRIRSP